MLLDFLVVFGIWLSVYVIGFPIAKHFLKSENNIFSQETLSIVFGITVLVILATWFITFEVPIEAAFLVIFALTFVAFRVGLLRRFSSALFSRNRLGEFVYISVLSLFTASPQISPEGRIALGTRIGPDGIGYGVASQALANNQTLQNLEASIESQLQFGDINSALSARVQSVYSLPSVTEQIQAEYLIGAKRWGLPFVAGIYERFLGLGSVWVVLFSLTTLGLLAALLAIRDLLNANKVANWKIRSAIIAISLNASLLNVWHEGGFAQIFTLSAVVILAGNLLLLHMPLGSIPFAVNVAAISLLITSYSDNLFISIIMAVIFIFVSAIKYDLARLSAMLNSLASGLLISFAFCFPVVGNFARLLGSRSEDSDQAGWMQPSWPTLADLFGLRNSYENPSGILSAGVSSSLVLLMALTFVLFHYFYRNIHFSSYALLWTVVIIFGLFWVKTAVLDQNSNYQLFKLTGTLAPIAIMSLAVCLDLRAEEAKRFKILPAALLFGLLLLNFKSSASWMSDWRNLNGNQISRVTWTNAQERSIAYSPELSKVFSSYDFVDTPSTPRFATASLGDFRWINRGTGGKPVNTSSPSRPIAFIADQISCPSDACLVGLDPKALIFQSDTLSIVRIGPDSAILDGISPAEACNYVDDVWTSLTSGKTHLKGCRLIAR